ncbi:MAG TPA: hypothetical protein VF163_18145 [Micromonosporaceae bacterium]
MTAGTVYSRPTVEDTTAAHAAFSWAFRGESTQAQVHLETLDERGLAGVVMAAALVTAAVGQIRNRRAMDGER